MAAVRRLAGHLFSSTLLQSSSPSFSISRRGIASKLFVGGLSFYTTEKGLSEAFAQYGQVIEAKVPMDRASGRSKGFGFVTYAADDEAEKAIQGLNGKSLYGRVIFVDYAKPKSDFGGGGMPIARGPPISSTRELILDQNDANSSSQNVISNITDEGADYIRISLDALRLGSECK